MPRRIRDVHPIEWLLLCAGIVLFLRYAWFFDDAFIYFRYVDNFVLRDLGLVYNPGEYVEGYSSPIWVFVLSALRATGLGYPTIVTAVGLVCLVAVWSMLVVLERRMSGGVRGFPTAMLLLLPNYAVLTYFSSGLETPLLLVASVAHALYLTNPSSLPLRAVLALSPLVRQELLIPVALAVLWTWWRARRPPWTLVASVGCVLAALALFRITYYADFLPSTFYLKDASDYRQGLAYLHDTLSAYHVYEFCLVLGALAWWLARRAVDDAWRLRLAMAALAVPVALYCVRIGGDFIHFRYLAYPFVLIACAFAGVPELAWRERFGDRHRLLLGTGALVVAFQVAASYPAQLDRHPLRGQVRHHQVEGIEDAVVHRQYFRRTRSEWLAGADSIATSPPDGAAFPKNRPLVSGHCADNYFAHDRRVIHTYGLTDALLARTRVPYRRLAHKTALGGLAVDLARIQRASDVLGRGMYAAAVRRGDAPGWIVNNLACIELVERKVYNEHDFWENARLAFSFPGTIDPGAPDPSSRAPEPVQR